MNWRRNFIASIVAQCSAFDVQELMHSVVGIFSDLNADVERWQSRSIAPVDPVLAAEMEEFEAISIELYRRLEILYGRTFNLMRAMESIGFRQKEFLEAWLELPGITILPVEKVKRAAQQVHEGKVRSLAEVRNELWDSPVR